jgi:predicted NUDIX family phosphoesterase
LDKFLHEIAYAYKKNLTEKSPNLGNIKVGHDSRLEINTKTMKCKFIQEFRPSSMLAIADVIKVAVGQDYDGETVLSVDANRVKPNVAHPPTRIEKLNYGWVPREVAESNESFQHLIPYVAVTNSNGEILVYERNGGEKKLHGLLSIGWGGHIDRNQDGELTDGGISVTAAIFNCLYREIEEELGIDLRENSLLSPIYFARYNATPVDRVHACLAFKAVLDKPDEIARAARYGEWVDMNPLEFNKYLNEREKLGLPHLLETWSADLLHQLTETKGLPLH